MGEMSSARSKCGRRRSVDPSIRRSVDPSIRRSVDPSIHPLATGPGGLVAWWPGAIQTSNETHATYQRICCTRVLNRRCINDMGTILESFYFPSSIRQGCHHEGRGTCHFHWHQAARGLQNDLTTSRLHLQIQWTKARISGTTTVTTVRIVQKRNKRTIS